MNKSKKLGLLVATLAASTLIAACAPTGNEGGKNGDDGASDKFVANKPGSFLIGKDGLVKDEKLAKDTPIIDIYFDPICPGCGEFEVQTSAYVKENVEKGTFLVRYHPLSFLDASSTDNYSTRMAAYILGVSDHASDLVLDFMAKAFSEELMPMQGPDYVPFTNANMEQVFISVGGTKEQAKKITDSMDSNMEKAYQHTIDVMTDSALIRKSPTGSLFTPFVIPNNAGKDDGNAIGFHNNSSMLEQLQEQVDKLNK